eukprot:scaffold172889_cov30-Tisochrysis_lutea.AAC.3
MDPAWVFDTPVTSPVKSPQKPRPYDFPEPSEYSLEEHSGKLEEELEKRSAEVMTWQLFSTTLIVLVVAATASLATNRVSEILFVALGAYLLIRGVMSSFVSNILAPGSGPFGFLARKFVDWMNFPSIDSAAQLLSPKDGDTVLEIGAADGRGLRAILYLCNPKKLYATETSPTALEALRANPAFATVETHDDDARSLTFLPTESIDKVSSDHHTLLPPHLFQLGTHPYVRYPSSQTPLTPAPAARWRTSLCLLSV